MNDRDVRPEPPPCTCGLADRAIRGTHHTRECEYAVWRAIQREATIARARARRRNRG